jgi:alkanesulfonate monooxygenase SsuD/methylene tetrahydromethanopterin reductase-like flavin-dependent oxidoreductase (luciferase family)
MSGSSGFGAIRSRDARRVPVVVGGNSDPALARAAAWADGWYGFNVPVADVPGRLADLHAHCRREGRDLSAVDVSVALADGSPDDVPALDRVGVGEVVLVESPPADAGAVDRWIDGLADRWKVSG